MIFLLIVKLVGKTAIYYLLSQKLLFLVAVPLLIISVYNIVYQFNFGKTTEQTNVSGEKLTEITLNLTDSGRKDTMLQSNKAQI